MTIDPENQATIEDRLARIGTEKAKPKPNRTLVKQWFRDIRNARGDEHTPLPQAAHTKSTPAVEGSHENEDSRYIVGAVGHDECNKPVPIVEPGIEAAIDGESPNPHEAYADLTNRLLRYLTGFLNLTGSSPERRCTAMAVAIAAASKCIAPETIDHRTDEQVGELLGVGKAAVNRALQQFREEFPEITRNRHFRSDEAREAMSQAKRQLTSKV